ncbi:hypothetical protein X741_26830 [Mesorhizobium sp. LNHC229A00]|nr:hypothetical protein X741_26830 [Mesorhizobium sp. LNHC229A00]
MIVAKTTYRCAGRSIDVASPFAVRDEDTFAPCGSWQNRPNGTMEEFGHANLGLFKSPALSRMAQ